MKEQVLIFVTGRQRSGADTEETTQKLCGRLVEKGDVRYLTYEETDADSGVKTRVTLKVEPARAVMLRSGQSNARMEFFPGRETVCDYDTGAGVFVFHIQTESLRTRFDAQSGSVRLCYALLLEGRLLSRNEVYITVRERTSLNKNQE